MNAGAFQDALRHMPTTTVAELTKGRPFVVLSPHPDDESLGMGGIIAAACEAGQRVEIVVLTDGSGSHTKSKLFPRDMLVALREAEAAEAAARLGLPAERIVHFGLPDAHAPMSGDTFEASVDRLEHRVRQSDAASLFVTWGRDPHCDHEAADAMARALRHRMPGLALWSYPIWGWHLEADREIDEPAPRGHRIDIARWQAAKHAAIAAHRSQMTDLIADDPDGFRFDERSLAPFLGTHEYVFEVPA